MNQFRFLFVFLASVLASSCSLLSNNVVPVTEWSAEKMDQEAKDALKAGDYQTAIEYFENLQTRYPFGKYAEQAMLFVAYAYYRFDERELAISEANRFIKKHPRHERVDYAYYLKGLANFNPSVGPLDDLFNQDAAERDAAPMLQAFKDFSELIRRFPNSTYAEDSRKRMIFVRNSLARYELNVARFYFRRKAYVAASKRSEYIITHFQGSPSTKAALYLLAESYQNLGLDKARKDTLRVIELNYPNKSKKDTQSLSGRT